MRTFVAAFPAFADQRRIFEAIHELTAAYQGSGHRFTPAENFHLTFRFLGVIDDVDIPKIRRALAPVAAATRRCSCATAKLVALPNASRPRVVALAIESGGSLEALGNDIETALAAQFGPADRDFFAHLSVVRCNAGTRMPALATPPATRFTIATLGLYRSDTLAAGARYSPLFELPFG